MRATKNNSLFVSEIMNDTITKYQLELNQTPKSIDIDTSGEVIPDQIIGVNNPYYTSLFNDKCAVHIFDSNKLSVQIDVYKFDSYWVLQDTIVTPLVNEDRFQCKNIVLYNDQLLISTSQWNAATPATKKYRTFIYSLDSSSTWVLNDTIITTEMSSIGLYKDIIVIYNNQNIDIYKNSSGWTLEQSIININLPGNDINTPIDISDTTFIIGAPTNGDGSVFLYMYDGSTWNLSEELAPSAASYTEFGYDVSMNGNNQCFVVSREVGATPGWMYVYDYNGTNWAETQYNSSTDGSGFKEGNFISVANDIGIVPGSNKILYLTKDLSGTWNFNDVPSSTGLGDINRCNVDQYKPNISVSNMNGDYVQIYNFNETNTKNYIKTYENVPTGTKGFIYDGIDFKEGTYGPTNDNLLDIRDFNLQQPSEKAYLAAAIAGVCVTNSLESCIAYDKELNVNTFGTDNIQTTETTNNMIQSGEYIIIVINGTSYDVKTNSVGIIDNGGTYDYNIQFDDMGAAGTQAFIKSKAQEQLPIYSYDPITDEFQCTFREMSGSGSYIACSVIGDTDTVVDKLKLNLFN